LPFIELIFYSTDAGHFDNGAQRNRYWATAGCRSERGNSFGKLLWVETNRVPGIRQPGRAPNGNRAIPGYPDRNLVALWWKGRE
jgi:hypothetical protein